MTSVFIIAASDVVRAGLESLVSGEADLTIVGSAVDLPDFAAQGAEGPDPIRVPIHDPAGRHPLTPAAGSTTV